MIRHLLIAGLLLAAAPALAAPDAVPDTVYEGVAGPAPIVVHLSAGAGDVTGAYFYRGTRLDIDLSGTRRGGTVDLSSDVTGDKISLTRSGADLTGTLTTAKGRRLAVSLHPAVAPAALPADLPAGLDLYDRIRLAGLSFTPQATETLNGKTIRWYREPLTGLRLFRIESGYAGPAIAAMNHALARNQWSSVSEWLQCTGADGRPGGDSSKTDTPWLGPAHLSYVWRSSWDCAGTAHPDFAAEGHSFDAATGRELKLDEVLPEGRAPAPPENSDAWLDYRGKVFAPAVVGLMKRYHPAEMKPPKSDDDCNYSDPEPWSFPSWALTEKGLWLGAVFARVMRACDSPEWAVIPWSALPPAIGAKR
jgi:hypothetical protein